MDKFVHTHDYCASLVKENQLKLLLINRKCIHDKIIESIKNSSGNILVSFDSRLDNIHRKTLIIELLERFNSLNLIKDTSKPTLVHRELSSNNNVCDNNNNLSIGISNVIGGGLNSGMGVGVVEFCISDQADIIDDVTSVRIVLNIKVKV